MSLKNTDIRQRFGFRKHKAIKGLGAAVLGTFLVFSGSNFVAADSLFNGETQETPISRADIETLSDADKARIVPGQIDKQMSWIDENGNVTWVTDYVLVYEKSGECSVVPGENVTIPNTDGSTGATPETPSGTPTETTPSSPTIKTTQSTPTTAQKIVSSILPNTGAKKSTALLVAGVGLTTLAGYLMFKNKRTGKTIAVAILVATGAGFSSGVLAESTGFLDVVERIEINLDSTYKHTAAEDDCWKYVGYIPNIASKPSTAPTHAIPEGELPANETDIPNEAPTHEVPSLSVTRYITEDGVELATTEEGTNDPKEFDGYTFVNTTTDGAITTHVYRKVVNEVPNEAPTHEVPALTVTRYITEEGVELTLVEGGTNNPKEFDGYTFVNTTVDGPVTTHVYHKVVNEVPNEAPTNAIPELYVTRWVTTDGVVLGAATEGTLPANTYEGYEYQTTVTEGNGYVTTHVYAPATVTQVPNEAPTYAIPELSITVYKTPDGNNVVPSVVGDQPPVPVEGYVPGEPVYNGGIKIYTYTPIPVETPAETDVPNEAPTYAIPSVTMTRWITEDGTVLGAPIEGTYGPNTYDGYELVNTISEGNGSVTTHVYRPVTVTQVPNEAPTHAIPTLTMTRWVLEDGTALAVPTEGTLTATPFDGYELVSTITEGNGYVTTHIYRPVTVTEVPNEAPTHAIPEMNVTVYVGPDGNHLVPPTQGDQPPIEIDGYVPGEPVVENGLTIYTYEPKAVVEVPNEAPTHSIPTMTITVFRGPDGNELVPPVEGDQPPIPVEGYVPGEPVVENGVKIYTYEPKTVTEVPNDAPTHSIPEMKVTRYITEDSVELTITEEGTNDPKEFDGYTFVNTTVDGPITTHVYHKVVTEVPNEAPTHSIPEGSVKQLDPVEEKGSVVAHFVDEQGNSIQTPVNVVTDVVVNTVARTEISVNGESSIEESKTASGATYEATYPNTINFDGKVYEYVRVQDGSAEPTGTVAVGTTNVTFVYRHVPQVTTRQTEREVTGTIRTRHYSYDGQKLFYDMLGQQAPAPSPVTHDWYLNNYVWYTGNLDGDLDSGELTVVGSTNEVPVGKYVTTETLTDGVVTDTKTEYVDYKVPYDVRALKGREVGGDLVDGFWGPRSMLPEAQGGIGNPAATDKLGLEWFNRFFERDDTDGNQASTGFLKEGETVVTFLYDLSTERKTETTTTGNVNVKYVDTAGVEIKDVHKLVEDGIVSTTTVKEMLFGDKVTDTYTNTTPSNLQYDATTVKDNEITFNGSTYRFKQLKDGDVEKAAVTEGTTTVTYIYERVPVVETREETSQVTGNVNVKYVDTNGNEIKDMAKLIENGVVSNTTTTITTTDGAETGRVDNTVPTNLEYNTSTLKVDTIEYNGAGYRFKEVKFGDSETGLVKEGTTTVTYVYEVIPNTTESTSEPIYGNVVTRYINEVTGQEIVAGSDIVTQGVVANKVTTTEKNWKGEVVSTNTTTEPTGLTYDTTTDKTAKDAEIAVLRTAPIEYVNRDTGAIIQAGDMVRNIEKFVVKISHEDDYHHNQLAQVNGDISQFIVGGNDARREYKESIEDAINEAGVAAEKKGYVADQYTTRMETIDGTLYLLVEFTKDSAPVAVSSATDVPYEYVGVDSDETGTVEEGTKTITYRYRPTKAQWAPTTSVEEGDEIGVATVLTIARD